MVDEVKFMGTLLQGRYATPLDKDTPLNDPSHLAVARVAKAEGLAIAIQQMANTPCEVSMAQAAWLLTTSNCHICGLCRKDYAVLPVGALV